MMKFKILKKSAKSKARLGVIETDHGAVETPALIPVATQASVKTLTSELLPQTGTQAVIMNTFHLHLRPGEKIVNRAGGLHKFSNIDLPIMTDSGGFQVFSLGFGRDLGGGKINKQKTKHMVRPGAQPKLLKITEDGVLFRSPLDGTKLFLGPKESMRIQESLGADIIFSFDECTPPAANHAYTKQSLLKTHRWAKECLAVQNSTQALFGIVQGGKFKDLRIVSAKVIGAMPFDGFGIGGEFGNDKRTMVNMLGWVNRELPESKPRHLLGIGHPEDIPQVIKAGADTFDCIVPTHYARHGVAFTSTGRVEISKSKFLKDKSSLDRKCGCEVCVGYSRSYLCHLFRAKEVTGLTLLTIHNLYFFNGLVANLRKMIKQGKL
jgi:queuine tRNA-ribosyltransferase